MKLTALLAAVFLLGACSKNIQTPEAVRQSVVEDLNGIAAEKGVDFSAMQVEVASVSFERDEAHATITILPKSGQGGMQMPYMLDRKGDKWVVRAAAASRAESARRCRAQWNAAGRGTCRLGIRLSKVIPGTNHEDGCCFGRRSRPEPSPRSVWREPD